MSANKTFFEEFFQGKARIFLFKAIDMALEEDGSDWTSEALFTPQDQLTAQIMSKQRTLCVGLPLIKIVLDRIGDYTPLKIQLHVSEGTEVPDGCQIATISGPATTILKAERVILNFLSHLSGIANNTKRFVLEMKNSKTRLLDTRKTLPGLRYPEKYAVKMGGGANHRFNLREMLMLKDNHIDRIGSISSAVSTLRKTYSPCPPIEVECRNLQDVQEAVQSRADRIMLDNMDPESIKEALFAIPKGIESEISGGVTLDNICDLAQLGADYISVGCLTNSAPTADFSMVITLETQKQI